jgi:hypothetical protein
MYKIGDVVKFAYIPLDAIAGSGPLFEFEGEIIGARGGIYLIVPGTISMLTLEDKGWGFCLSAANNWPNTQFWYGNRVVVADHYDTVFPNGMRTYFTSMWIVPNKGESPKPQAKTQSSNDKFLDDLRLNARKYSTNSEGETGGPSGLRFL